jgi:hypothetical protein
MDFKNHLKIVPEITSFPMTTHLPRALVCKTSLPPLLKVHSTIESAISSRTKATKMIKFLLANLIRIPPPYNTQIPQLNILILN